MRVHVVGAGPVGLLLTAVATGDLPLAEDAVETPLATARVKET